jgi:hypothetical protein
MFPVFLRLQIMHATSLFGVYSGQAATLRGGLQQPSWRSDILSMSSRTSVNSLSNFTHIMSTENALKVPLMGDLTVDLENEDWRHFAEFHPQPQKTPWIKRILLRAFALLSWTLLVLLGVWNWKLWNEVQQCKARYYIRPELSYSKSHLSPRIYLFSTSYTY